MDIRPQDLPEIRADLIDRIESPGMLWFFEGRAQGRIYRGTSPTTLQKTEVRRLLEADLYYIAEPMAILAREAAKTLPPFQLFPEDLPSESGFAFLAGEAFQAVDRVQGASAFTWEANSHGVQFGLYADTDSMLRTMVESGQCTPEQALDHWNRAGRLSPMAFEAQIPYGTHEDIPSDDGGDEGPLIAAFRSMWLLMQQPLADTAVVDPDRVTRKRLQRAGREPAAVRVIELRRPKSGGGTGESGREYHHQWIVKGHWRNHWHPKRQAHRPVWIAPHVKGPEGAPLIGGEKVYALKR